MAIVRVKDRLGRSVEPELSHVAHDPDDGEDTHVSIFAAIFDANTDRILVRPSSASQSLADEPESGRNSVIAEAAKSAAWIYS